MWTTAKMLTNSEVEAEALWPLDSHIVQENVCKDLQLVACAQL